MRINKFEWCKLDLGRSLFLVLLFVAFAYFFFRPGQKTSGSQKPADLPVLATSRSGAVVAAAVARPAVEDLAKLFPASELPLVATEEGARNSLRYLASNGADLTRPMPSKHRVFAANAQIAAQLANWGRANGFEVRGPVLARTHTGQPQQTLELVRIEVPDPVQIEREGRLVLAAVQQTPGTYYQTWCGEIIR